MSPVPTWQRALAALVVLLAGALAGHFGHAVLDDWTFRGLVPGARHVFDTWPLVLWAALGLGVALSLAGLVLPRGAGSEDEGVPRAFEALASLALVVASWALCVSSMAALPNFASAGDLGAGPILRPLYGALALGAAWLATTRRFALAERALLLFVLWGTCNGKLFAADLVAGFGLVQAGGLVVLAVLGAGLDVSALVARARARVGGFMVLVSLLLIVWWVAAALSSGRAPALQLTWRLVIAALVALAALGAPWSDPRATARRVFTTLVAGVAIVAVAGLFGIVEAARVEPLDAVLHSRLRLIGLHPNLGAALFAAGAALALGWLGIGRKPVDPAVDPARPALRLVGLGLFAVALGVLALSGSRASMLGAAAGLAVFALGAFTNIFARIGWKTIAATFALGALAVFALVSPLGEGLRATLDAKAQTQSAIGQRWHIWRMVVAAVQDHPLFGLGPGGWKDHAAYAQPSYYDGTDQDLHTHNIFLAALEGAGWIGLALFTLWLGGLLSLLRRVADAAPRRGLALFAAVVALVVCNQLDLGQSQTTMVPLLFWAALVCGGLLLDRGAQGEPAPPARLPVALLGLVLLPVTTYPVLAGEALLMESSRALSRGQDEKGVKLLLDGFGPRYLINENSLAVRLTEWARRGRRLADELRFAELALEHEPTSAVAMKRLAQASISAGHFDRGVEVARQALAADPYGPGADAMRVWIAWGELGGGQREVGMRRLAEALVGGAKLPKEFERTFSGPDFDAAMRAELHALGAETVALASTDEVTARRKLAGLAQAFREFGQAGAAVDYIQGVLDASPHPMRATYYQLIVLLRSLGRDDDAAEVWKSSPYANEVNFQTFFAALDTSSDDEPVEGEALDLFFTSGRLAQRYMARARDLALAGDNAGAEHALERALFNAKDELVRVGFVVDFMAFADDSREARLWQVERYLERASVVRKRVRDPQTLKRVLDRCMPPFASHAELVDALGGAAAGLGPLGVTLDGLLGRASGRQFEEGADEEGAE